jgi:hypothetical protein
MNEQKSCLNEFLIAV